ncbi:MAG: hydrogen peroxide-inducible genes activator [Alphaproteobacteria bacterium]|nr:hydrogen peroxide-inducible genes activator [Alphaproteobacteria bacterium]
MSSPSLRQLQYLMALSRTGHFAKAAELCHVTQPTLSAGIADLEVILGHKLIDRQNRKKNMLTPFGREILKHADHILSGVDHLLTFARQYDAPMRGIVRLGIIPTIAPYLLPRMIKPLESKYPELTFQIFEYMSSDLLSKLVEGDLDAGIMAFPFSLPAGLTSKILTHEAFFYAVPKGAFKDKKSLSNKDLHGHKLLLLEDGHCLRQHALSACALQLPHEQKTFSATSLATLIQLVAEGYGITLLPKMVLPHVASIRDVQVLPFTPPAPTRQIGMVWRQSSPLTTTLKTLHQALVPLIP